MSETSSLTIVSAMTEEEARQAVSEYKSHRNSMYIIGLELYERDGWKVLGYSSWYECAKQELELGSNDAADRLINAGFVQRNILQGEVTANLRLLNDTKFSTSALLSLRKLPVDQQQDAALEAVGIAPDGKVTAAHIDQVVYERRYRPRMCPYCGCSYNASDQPPGDVTTCPACKNLHAYSGPRDVATYGPYPHERLPFDADEDHRLEVISKLNPRQVSIPREPMPIPQGKYRCIIVDPPWQIEKIARDVRPNQVEMDYPMMSLDELRAFPVSDLAADDCHLYLWTTHKYLPAALDLAQVWGFTYQCLMTWRKNVGFTPFSWMYSTEHVLFCRRGSLDLLRLGLRLDFDAPVREHSRKPDVFYDLVQQASPGPRIDMFAREAHEGFDTWGNEVDRFVAEAV